MVNPTPLSAAIRSIRTRLHLSQFALSRLLSVRENTVWRWENGQVVPQSWALTILYGRAETEEEAGPILRALESKGIALNMGAGAETMPSGDRPQNQRHA